MSRGLGLAVGVSALAAGAAGVEAQGPLAWGEFREIERVPADVTLPWAEHDEGHGDLYLPAGAGPHPVAVVVHGGCWLSIADAGYMSHFARFLADEGWAAWVPEFRRIDQEGAAWPTILEDVAAAADHLHVIGSEYRLDLERVSAFGHSSGGHLALWLAGREGLPPDDRTRAALRGPRPLRIRAVVGLAAVADLEDFDQREDRGCGSDIVERLLGGVGDDVADRMWLTSPSARLPIGVPQMMVTGALDATVPVAHGDDWVRRASQAGDPATMYAVEGAGHFEPVAPWTPAFQRMWPDIESFLDTLRLRPGQAPS